MKVLITRVLVLIFLLPLSVLSQLKKSDSSEFRFFIQASASEMKESFVIVDPATRLSRNAITRYNIGFAFAYRLNRRTSLVFDYQREQLGTSALFENPEFAQAITNGSVFSRFGLYYEKNVFPLYQPTRWKLFLKAGTSFSFASSPFSNGISEIWTLAPTGDTLESIHEQMDVKRSSFLSVGGAIGLRYEVNKRWFLNGSVNRMWNISSNDVTTNQVRYKAYDLPGVRFANIRTTGDVLSYRIGVGYNFHRNEPASLRKARIKKENAEADSVRKWSLIFNTGNHFPAVRLTDPAGYLTSSPYSRITFGLQLRYRLSDKWYLSGGFESFPNGVDPRPAAIFGGNGVDINNAYQFPISAEYRIYSLRKKVKLDVFVKSGLVLGVQFLTTPAESMARPDSSYFVFDTPTYYEEIEATTLRRQNFLAAAASLNVNLHLSRAVFLLGYVNQQVSFSNKPFIQRDVEYKMSPNQTGYYRATAYSTGTAFQVGFGLGYRW